MTIHGDDEVMGDAPEIDVEQIMDRIRENIRRRRSADESRTSENHVSPFDDAQAAADFAYLHSGYDIRSVSFVSHRPVIGPLIVAVKEALRKLLTPILERQVVYNAASTRVITHFREWVGTLDRQRAGLLGGQRLIMGDYVRGPGATRGATAAGGG